MNKIATLTFALLAPLFLFAQDKGKDVVEYPIKTSMAPAPAEKFDLAKTGIEWHRGLDAALNKGKHVLLFQLLGNFDDVHC